MQRKVLRTDFFGDFWTGLVEKSDSKLIFMRMNHYLIHKTILAHWKPIFYNKIQFRTPNINLIHRNSMENYSNALNVCEFTTFVDNLTRVRDYPVLTVKDVSWWWIWAKELTIVGINVSQHTLHYTVELTCNWSTNARQEYDIVHGSKERIRAEPWTGY